MPDRSKKHRALFEAGAEALRKFGGPQDRYRCPICCSDYDQRAIEKDSLDSYCLTLEHAPPKSLGGKVVALTCKKCNNTLGSQLDSQIASRENYLRFIDLNRPEPKPFSSRIVIDGNRDFVANVQLSGKFGSEVRLKIGQNNDPQALKQAIDKMLSIHDTGHPFRANFQIPNYDERLASLGYLKSAFLCLFAKFGYTYALSPQARFLINGITGNQKIDIIRLRPFKGHENRILLSDRTGVCFVGFGDFSVVCPWINSDLDAYSAAIKSPESFAGRYKELLPFEMPTRLEAILDKQTKRL